MPSTPAERPNRIPWPPLLYGAGLIVPWLLSLLVSLPDASLPEPFDALQGGLGWGLVAGGVALAWFAIKSFMGVETAVDPTKPATRLVTFGIYNQSRNPMYLGALVAFLGLAVATGNPWRFVALPLLWYGLMRLAIHREEAHLEARFGADWRSYASRVPRWW